MLLIIVLCIYQKRNRIQYDSDFWENEKLTTIVHRYSSVKSLFFYSVVTHVNV